MRPIVKVGLALFIVAIFSTTMVYSLNAGNVLPFSVHPEETGNHDGNHQFPQIEGSIKLNENQNTNLSALATINQTQAENLALNYTTGGSVVSATLNVENGYLIWNVIIQYKGQNYEIMVDAGNGNILWTANQTAENSQTSED